MYLKKYQQRVVKEIKEFLTIAKETKNSFASIINKIPEEQIINILFPLLTS